MQGKMVGAMMQQGHNLRKRPLWRRWRLLLPLALLFVVIVVLAVDLALKPEPAIVEHNWVLLNDFHTNSSLPTNRFNTNSSSNSTISPPSPAISADLGIRIVVLLSNPNLAGRFNYYDAGAYLFLDRRIVGQAPIMPGAIPTQSSRNLSTTLHANLTGIAKEGSFSMSTRTNMTGFVHKWGIFKHHYAIASSCELQLSTINTTLFSYSCGKK